MNTLYHRQSRARTASRYAISRLFVAARHCIQRGWLSHAKTILLGTVAAAPTNLCLRIILAHVAIQLEDDALAAETVAPDVVDKLPRLDKYASRLARIHLQIGDFNNAERYSHIAINAQRGLLPAFQTRFKVDEQRGGGQTRTIAHESLSVIEQATSLLPTMECRLLQSIADGLANTGDHEVEAIYRRILALDPLNGHAYYGLSECRKVTSADDSLISEITQLLASPTLSQDSRRNLHFALGDIFDRLGEHNTAFAHYSIANQLKCHILSQSPSSGVSDYTRRVSSYFTADVIDALSSYGHQDDFLICIIGMPRSGTTLVHQILCTSPNIFGAGERQDFLNVERRLPAILRSSESYPACLDRLKPNDIRRLSHSIYVRLRAAASRHGRVVTKLPDDASRLGLIKILFPRTKFVHCRRSLYDTCLSCYFQNFQFLEFSNSLPSLVEAYRHYFHLMQHWSNVLPPGDIFDVNYEDLVSNPHDVAEELFTFTGLPFTEDCLNFNSCQRSVATASRFQVRQPLYPSSINRSAEYRHFLGALSPLESLQYQKATSDPVASNQAALVHLCPTAPEPDI